jgi:hypothetical protein
MDVIDSIKEAINRVSFFSGFNIEWGDQPTTVLGDRDVKTPRLNISINQETGVDAVTTSGFIGVRYFVNIQYFSFYNKTDTSYDKIKAIFEKEKYLRKIVKELGALHSEGLSNCEIDETSISQKSDTSSMTNLNESSLTFTLTFDEE